MCSTTKILQNPLNSFDINWVALSETMETGTMNLTNSSCRNPITTAMVGFLHQQSNINYELLSEPAKSICRRERGRTVSGHVLVVL